MGEISWSLRKKWRAPCWHWIGPNQLPWYPRWGLFAYRADSRRRQNIHRKGCIFNCAFKLMIKLMITICDRSSDKWSQIFGTCARDPLPPHQRAQQTFKSRPLLFRLRQRIPSRSRPCWRGRFRERLNYEVQVSELCTAHHGRHFQVDKWYKRLIYSY